MSKQRQTSIECLFLSLSCPKDTLSQVSVYRVLIWDWWLWRDLGGTEWPIAIKRWFSSIYDLGPFAKLTVKQHPVKKRLQASLRQSHKFDPVCCRLKNKKKMHFETAWSKGLDLWEIKSRDGRKIFKKKRGINTWNFECTSSLRIKVPISYFEECCLRAAEIRQNSAALKFLFMMRDCHQRGTDLFFKWHNDVNLNIKQTQRRTNYCWPVKFEHFWSQIKEILLDIFLFASDEFDIRHRPAPLLPQQNLELKKTNKMHLELKSNEPHLEKQAQQ